MYDRDSYGKQEKARRKGLPSSSNFDEDDKKEKRNLTGSSNSEVLVRRVSAEKRKLKLDHTDVRLCPMKRRPDAKRLCIEADDILRKRSKVTAASQGPIKHQEVSHSATGPGISQSPVSNGTKKGLGRWLELKPRDTQLANTRRKLDSGIQVLSTPKGPETLKPKADCLTREQHSVMKEAKLERLSRAPVGYGRCMWDKGQRMHSAKDCHPDLLGQEPLDPRRKKINFRIPLRSRNSLPKLVEESTFRSKSKAGEEKGGTEDPQGLPKMREPRNQLSFRGPVSKPAICEWVEREHKRCGNSEPCSGGKVSGHFKAPCSVPPESSQDMDEEMQIVEELHAARVGNSVDLSSVPGPGELTSMEIDLMEEDVPPSAANTTSDKKLLIVIDTNILMNHLKFVQSLKTIEIPGFDRLVLIIPWVVVQELDRMKAGKLLKHAQHKAIPAVHFIHDGLREPDRKLWGQPLQLASQRLYGLSDENNDDRVLKCCLQYQELFPCSLVILCTDDRNLRSKGLISGVKSLSKEELNAECQSLTLSSDSGQPDLPQQPVKTETKPSEGSPEEVSAASPEHAPWLSDLLSQLEKSLGSALSSILETEMKLAFGDLWMEVLYLKPPWTLLHLLQCFRKHWLAVFGLAVENSLLATVDNLYDNLTKASKVVDLATVKFLLLDSKSLLLAFSVRSNYDGILPQAFAHVTRLLQAVPKVKVTLHPAPPENAAGSRQGEAAATLNSHCSAPPPAPAIRHQEIWSILENVWITIYQNSTDVFQRLGSDSPLTSSKIVSLEEAFLSLQKLMVVVKDILVGIQRVLTPNSSYQDIEPLYSSLVKYEVNTHVRFTAQELYECVSLPEYREKLAIGCGQLENLERAMQQCHVRICLGAQLPPAT